MCDTNKRKRIVLLTGQDIYHDATSATLIEAGLNIVGICRASSHKYGLPINIIIRWIKRGHIIRTIGQIIGRMTYKLFRNNADKKILQKLYDRERIENIISSWGGPILNAKSYSEPEVFETLKNWMPDVFVVHTSEWVSKKIRNIPADGLVIGGHPGITPQYRGAHSAFWAIYNNDFANVGWSVFYLDEGVDTGDVIQQGYLKIIPEDSYFTLGWKGMIAIAKAQAEILLEWERSNAIPRNKHQKIPDDSEYPVPSLFTHWRYWRNIKGWCKKCSNV